MLATHKHLITGIVVLLLSTPLTTTAQVISNTQNTVDLGTRGDLRVDPTSLGVNIQIPLRVYPGRGQTSLSASLFWSSKIWRMNYVANYPEPLPFGGVADHGIVDPKYAEHSVAGWTSGLDLPWYEFTGGDQWYDDNGDSIAPPSEFPPNWQFHNHYVRRMLVHMADGTTYELRSSDQVFNGAPSNGGVYYAVDNSRVKYDPTTGLWLPDGSRYVYPGGNIVQFIDRNGNTLTFNTSTRQWTDTLGRTISMPPLDNSTAGDLTYNLPGVNGLPTSYTLRWRNLADVRTDPTQPLRYNGDTPSASPSLFVSVLNPNTGVVDYVQNTGTFNPIVLSEIVLPNGTSYRFTYNVWGEIDKITYPFGGYERFQYQEVAGLTQLDGVYAQGNRGAVQRWVSSTGLSSDEVVWQYAPNSTTAPDGTVTTRSVHTSNANAAFGFQNARTGLPYEERVYAPGGQMLRRKLIEYAVSGPMPSGYVGATRNARVSKEVEIILDTGGDALVKTTTHDYDTTFQFSTGVYETAINEYGFATLSQTQAQNDPITSMPLGTLMRRTERTYLDATTQAYRDRNILNLVASETIMNPASQRVAEMLTSYDESAYPLLTYGALVGWTDPNTNVRGNVTSVSTWLNTSNSYLPTHRQYDQCGNIRNIWDARDTTLTNPSQIEYSATYLRAFPTFHSSADPDGTGPLQSLTTTTEYDLTTGRVTAQIDENGQRTILGYNDPLNRLKQVIRAETDPQTKSQTTYDYNDTGHSITVTTDLNSFNDNTLKTETVFDGLGRPKETRTYEGATNYISVKQQYDSIGRVFKTSNPFRPWQSETELWTTRVFDSLGRVTSITTPDNSVMSTSYSGVSETVTDQAGKLRKSISDALGRVKEVYEAPNDPNFNYLTSYEYDLLDDLVKVTQGSQQRFFLYDSLKRLIRVDNPEHDTNTSLNLSDPVTEHGVWSTGYQYDANGNLTQKTDARGIVCTYVYDSLNRNTTIDYSNTSVNPDVSRFYDGAANGKGRLWYSYAGGNQTAGTNVEKTEITSYDAMGRPKVLQQSFKLNGAWISPYQVSRNYNLASGETLQTYPSGHTVTYNYDSAGRLADKDSQNLAFTGNLGDGAPRTYSRGIIYAPAGQLKQEQFGTATPVYNKLFYNSRRQLAEILASTTGGDTSWNRGKIVNAYSLQCSGSGCNATDNNSNLRKQEVYIPANDQVSSYTSWYQQYDYDAVNRLLRVHEYTGNTQLDWQQEYDYDQWGNRKIHQTNTWGTNIPKPNFGVNTAKNRLTAPMGFSLNFDDAGNLTTDTVTSGGGDRFYDAENRMTKAWANNQWQEYTYDADGHRTRRKINGQETWQIYGFDGELIAEYPISGATNNPTKEYGYRNGQLLITAEAGNASAPPIFADDFNDNSINPTSWSVYYPGSSPTVSEQSQQLQIALSPNTAGYNGVYSNSTYNLTNRMVQVESVQSVSQAGWCENFFEVELDANNYFMIQVGAGNMIFRSRVNGVNDQISIPFDGAANRFWRIRHDQTANLIYFETSADDSVWLTRKTVTPGFSLTSLRFHLLAGAYGTGNSTPGTAKYDNFKLLANNGGSTPLTVPNSGFEAPVVGNGNFQYAPAGGSWTFANGGGISGNNSPFTGVPSAAPEGVQVAFLQATGTASQSISGFQANTSYVITFKAIQRTNCCNTGGQDIGVYLDDVLLASFHPGSAAYLEYSTPVFATSTGAHTVKFAGLNPLGGDHTAFIDNVRITGSPRPGFGVEWLLADQLGTPRMVFDESGALVNVKRHDYLPFGEELNMLQGLRGQAPGYATNADGVRQQFTAKERDTETGLDYFGARYYASSQGRFTSTDPLMASAYVGNPQSWNRYTYALNNPLRYVDLEGTDSTPVFRDYKDLTDDEKRILENSKVTVGKGKSAQTLSGEALYNYMKNPDNNMQKQLANFLNQTAVLSSITFANGRTAVSYVNSVREFRQDRIIANVDTGFVDQVKAESSKKSEDKKRYVGPENSGTLHGDFDTAYRENRSYTSQQISFASKEKFAGADIDIDEECPCGSAAGKHAGRVVVHRLFGGKTDPYFVYERLTRAVDPSQKGRAIQPSYTIVKK